MDTEQIEIVFREMCQGYKVPRYDIYHVYQATKARLNTQYYPYIRDKQPFMTDHGIGHISRVLEKLGLLLKPHIPLDGEVPDERSLNLYELNLLLNSTIWHDIGNLYGRIDHPQNISKVFKIASEFLYDDHDKEWIRKIAQAHAGEKTIESIIEVDSLYIHEFCIYPRFLAALLRFADELDEDRRRIGEKIYSDIPDGNKVYWFFCKCNNSINVAPDLEGSTVLFDCKIGKEELFGNFQKEIGNGKDTQVTAIEELIQRIDKINQARMYCNKFLEGPHYFRQIKWIDLDMKIYQNDAIIDKIEFRFSDSQGYPEFFASHLARLESYR